MEIREKFTAKAMLFIMISLTCSFALAGAACIDMAMGHRFYIFEITAKIAIIIGILAYASLSDKSINTYDSKYFTPFLLIAMIPFLANGINYFRIPNRFPGAVEWSNVLTSVFTTAAWEEMLFRYVGRTLFERDGKYRVRSVVLLSLTFGCSHLINIFFYDPIPVLLQVIHASSYGVFLLALYRRTGSLWVTVTAHFLGNFAAAFFDFFPDSEILFNSLVNLFLLTIAQLGIGIYILVKNHYIVTKKASS